MLRGLALSVKIELLSEMKWCLLFKLKEKDRRNIVSIYMIDSGLIENSLPVMMMLSGVADAVSLP